MEMSIADTKNRREIAWRIELSLCMTEIDPPALLWAAFVEDPLTKFGKELIRLQSIYHHLNNLSKDRTGKRNIRLAHLISCWDSSFRYIGGDEVYLATEVPSVTSLFSLINPLDKIWIATKAIMVFGEPLCWCLPIKVKIGALNVINLSKDNVIRLLD